MIIMHQSISIDNGVVVEARTIEKSVDDKEYFHSFYTFPQLVITKYLT
jgi:hypothetical protein